MNWSKVKLGEFLINRENRFKPNDEKIAGLKRIDKIDFSGNIFLSNKISNTDMILVKKGDLVISGINVEKGAMNVYQNEEDVTATIHYSSYSFNEQKIDIDFLKMFLKSPEFKSALKEQVPGGIKTEIKPKHILPLEVVIPTKVSVQRELVKEFRKHETMNSELNSEISKQQELVKQLRQAFLKEAMQGKLIKQDKKDGNARELLQKIKYEKEKLTAEKKIKKEKLLPPIREDEIPFDIPENWVWSRLGEVIDFISGNNFNSTDFNNENGAKCIKITNAGVGRFVETDDFLPITFLEKYKSYLVFENDLILALTRPYISEGLKISKCPKSYDSSLLNQRVAVIRPRNLILSEFIFQFLRSDYLLNLYKSKFDGKSQQPNLKKEDIIELLIPLPPLPEQTSIVKKLEQLMKQCDELQANINNSKEHNVKLLQQVLKEALRPKD